MRKVYTAAPAERSTGRRTLMGVPWIVTLHAPDARAGEAAVEAADGIARKLAAATGRTATVLLSPAAASFDMFEDYAARGQAFKAAVAAVLARRAGAPGGQA